MDILIKKAYEFFGCYWHGCNCTFKDNRDEKIIKTKFGLVSPNERYNETLDKIKFLKTQCEVISIWECELKNILNNNKELKDYFNMRFKYHRKYVPINIRDSLFGGRTNNLQFHYKTNDETEIKYLDVCSLYPWVLKYFSYPQKHPKIIKEDFDYTLKNYFGFIKCRITPPKQLYLPVLPVMLNSKLVFPLCLQCAKTQNTDCKCIDRSFEGTWTTEEVKLAMKHNYVINEIHEILDYEKNIDDNKFKKYIDVFKN